MGGMKYIMSKKSFAKLTVIQGAAEGRYTLKGFGVNNGLYSIPLYMIASFADMLVSAGS